MTPLRLFANGRTIRVLLILLPALLITCRGPLSPEITEEDLRHHLGILSSDGMAGRMTGTPQMEMAVTYITQEYRRAGLLPFFPDYVMPFTFTDGMEAREGNTLEWNTGLTDSGANAPASTHSELSSIIPMPFGKPGIIEGDLISGGWCLPPHDGQDELNAIEASGISLAGKILVCRRYGPHPGDESNHALRRLVAFQSKYENARRFRPAGILFLQGTGDEVRTEQFPGESKDGPAAAFVLTSTAFASALEHMPSTTGVRIGHATIKTNFGPLERTGKNIGAMLKPAAPGQKLIFVGAHYDHLGLGLPGSSMGPMGQIYNGADDNGSGTVLVLEMAAAMKARLETDPAYLPPGVNVVFLNFDAEERGLFGSARFVDSPGFDPSRTIGMLNADMVGRLRKSRGLFVQGTEAAGPELKKIVEEAYGATIPRVLPESESPEIRWMKGGMGPSDHASFYRKKVPILFLFTGSHGEYHRPEDDYSLINFRGLRAITLFSEAIVRRLAFAHPAPEFRAVKEEPHREDFDFKVRLGIVPGSYDSSINGILVGGLVSGAPVARTGIKDGDIIVELGGAKIHDIHDLMRFLNDARTGVNYTIHWIRNGQVMEGKTELMSTDD